MPPTTCRSTAAFVPPVLAIWGIVLVAVGVNYLGREWVYAAFVTGGATLLLALWGLVTRRDAAPLIGALLVLSIGLITAGVLTDVDIYPAVGVVLFGITTIGGLLAHRLERIAEAIERRDAGD